MAECPGSTIVAVAWLDSVGTLPPAATSRPADPTTWSATGFVVVSAVGSAGVPDLAQQRRPVLSLDVWAASPGSSRPPRAMAAGLAERARAAVEAFTDPIMVTPHSGSVAYLPALVTDLWLVTAEPREIPDPDATYAHFSLDVGLAWVLAS